MNFIGRIFFKKLLKNILENHGILTEESKISALFWRDGFLVKKIRLRLSREAMERDILLIINDQPFKGVNYNTIKVKGDSLLITYEDYFSCPKSSLTKTDLRSGAVPWDAMKEICSVNAVMVIGQSGSGKTTLVRELISIFSSSKYNVMNYSLKTEDFPNGSCKGFEPENLVELEKFLNELKEDRSKLNQKIFLVIDEFFVLMKIGEIGPRIGKAISDLLPYCRSGNVKIALLSQSLNRSKLKDFSVELVGLKLLSIRDIASYQESIGRLEGRFLMRLNRGQFVKLGMDEDTMIITHRLKKSA